MNVKKPRSFVAIAVAAILLLSTAVAIAWGISYSPKATATLNAREVLMERYHLSQEMVRLFIEDTQVQGDSTITTFKTPFQSNFMNSDAMGVYTVTITNDESVSAAWSHDDVDPATWQNADLTSSVWGAPQLQQMLDRWKLYQDWQGKYSAIHIHELPYEEQAALYDELAALIAPLLLDESDAPVDPEKWIHRFDDQIAAEANATPEALPEETPAPTQRPGDITAEQAVAIATQAMMEIYHLSAEEIAEYETEVMFQYQTDGECTVMFYGTMNMGCVRLNSTNGEIEAVILDSDVGGKG